jgi:sugar phosphate isomerase/epimerase
MKLGVMPAETIPSAKMKEEGFEASQLFWGMGDEAASKDPTPENLIANLAARDHALAAMTLHIDLVGPRGRIDADVERTVDLVGRTAALDVSWGDNPRPILVWHPARYPDGDDLDDDAVFEGVCSGLADICGAAEKAGVDIAVELTRNSPVGSAETFLHLVERVGSSALKVCIDAANFCPDRTPLVRAVRRLAPYTAIAHGKDLSFKTNGEPDTYGPTGSGELDYDTYIKALLEFVPDVPYFVLEYYKTRVDLVKARDIVLAAMKS